MATFGMQVLGVSLIFGLVLVMSANTIGFFLIARSNRNAITRGIVILERIVDLNQSQTDLHEYTNRMAREGRERHEENSRQIALLYEALSQRATAPAAS